MKENVRDCLGTSPLGITSRRSSFYISRQLVVMKTLRHIVERVHTGLMAWYIYCVSSLQFDHVIRLVIDSVQNIADVINYNSQLHECIIIPCFNVCKHSFLCGELMSFTFVLENVNMFIIVRFILFNNLLCIYM